jgi:hypothetical protein
MTSMRMRAPFDCYGAVITADLSPQASAASVRAAPPP